MPASHPVLPSSFRFVLSSLRNIAVCCFLVTALSGRLTFAQTSTWVTGHAGNWNDPTNWSGGVPTATSNVLIDGDSFPDYPSSVTLVLGETETVANLTLNSDDSLTLNTGSSLTVNGTAPSSSCFLACAVLNGKTNVDLGTLTLNTTSLNQGTMSLATSVLIINGHPILLGIGTLNGTGTLENNGTIQGSGNLSPNITNTGTINNNDGYSFFINGNIQNAGGTIEGEVGPNAGSLVLNGSTISGGTILNGNLSSTGGTLDGVTLNKAGSTTTTALQANSTLTVGSNGVMNQGLLELAAGTVISGPGTLFNQGSPERPAEITGGGTIASNVFNAGVITTTEPINGLTLQGKVTQILGLGTGIIYIGSGALRSTERR